MLYVPSFYPKGFAFLKTLLGRVVKLKIYIVTMVRA
jgi:hypothetical protein